jgi:glycosyltransferase involved in cell wall biosynthesis
MLAWEMSPNGNESASDVPTGADHWRPRLACASSRQSANPQCVPSLALKGIDNRLSASFLFMGPDTLPDRDGRTAMQSDPRVTSIVEFIKSDPALHCYYLLHFPECGDSPLLYSYDLFLFWFISFGRRTYNHPLAIPAAIREAIASPRTTGSNRLMEFVLATTAGKIVDRKEALARYYFQALPKFGLGPFLSRAEMGQFNRGGLLAELAHLAQTLEMRGINTETEISNLFYQLDRLTRTIPPTNVPSISIVGFHRSILGLGEDARSLFECLLDSGINPELVDVSPSTLEPYQPSSAYRAFEALRPNSSVVIFCMPMFEMARVICTLGLLRPPQGQYWIGYWPWETSALPPDWTRAFTFVDEVWCSSQFLYKTYRRYTQKPVVYIPLNVSVPSASRPTDVGELFGSKFTFICVFDFNSRIQRKNPLGAIYAFRAAFPNGTENVQLILKTLHGERQPEDFDAVYAAIGEDERIIIVDGPLSRQEVCWLIQSSQAYLSLHRSEGFGRCLAEAMLLGTPVVGTGWSGSSDFLNEDTGFPIRYRLQEVGAPDYPFAAGEWAEPDIEHAADVMRELYRRGAINPRITSNAKAAVTKLFSRASVSSKLVDRIVAIGRELERGN